MLTLYILLWIGFFIIAYSYAIYPILLYVIALFKKPNTQSKEHNTNDLPTITLFVTAYNEEKYVCKKVQNSNNLIYPKHKLKQIWLTDGSTDKTNELLAKHTNITVHHNPQRKGKTNAINRGMAFVDTDLVVFSDANTMLNKDALINMAKHFDNKQVGCVAGEKRIETKQKDSMASYGEGFYWRYESKIKKLDAIVGSTIGAVGELFAIRTSLFTPINDDSILDDFIISMQIAMQGYKIAYSPNAFAIEKPSVNIDEEMKRKTRIAAGSIQTLIRLKELLNPLKYSCLSVQYISHKVLRWTIIPCLLPLLIVLNTIIIAQNQIPIPTIYYITAMLQATMYMLVIIGKMLKNKPIRINFIFIPYYFFIANYAMYLGFFKYIKGKQTVIWEQAKRG